MERTENRFVTGQKLGAHRINQLQNTIDATMPFPSSGACITTRGNYVPIAAEPRRASYFEAACALDGSGSVTIGVVAQPYVTNTNLWTHSLGDTLIRFKARGRYLVIFRYSMSIATTGSTYSRQFVAISQTVDNSLVATDLFWQSWASVSVANSGVSIPTASGSISCVLNAKTDLTDGGFKIRYTLAGTGGTFGFTGNLSIVGPIL